MRRFLAYLFKRIIVLIAIMCAITYWILCTASGFSTAIKFVAVFVPGKLTIGQVSGRLISNFHFKNLSYEINKDKIFISDADFTIDGRKLLKRQLIFNRIDIKHSTMRLASSTGSNPSSASSSPSSFAWLSQIELRDATFSDMNFDINGNVLHISKIKQREKDGKHYIDVDLLDGRIASIVKINWERLAWELQSKIRNINPHRYLKTLQGNINFDLAFVGEWDKDKKLELNINEIKGHLQSYPLTGQINLSYLNNAIHIRSSKLMVANAYAEVDGNFNESWQLKWKLNVPSLSTILPGKKGLIISEGQVLGSSRQPKLQAHVKISDLLWDAISIQNIDGKMITSLQKKNSTLNLTMRNFKISDYAIPHIEINALSTFEDDMLMSDLAFTFTEQNKAKAKISLPQFFAGKGLNQTIEAKIDFGFKNITDFLKLPYVTNLIGMLQGEAIIAGKLNSPTVIAKAKLQDASMQIPSYGLHLQKVNLNAQYNESHRLTYTGEFISGTGHGQVDGDLNVQNEGYPFNLKLSGKDLTIMNTNEYKIKATPDIQLNFSQNTLSLNGTVFVPKVTIRAKENNNITTLPTEVVFVNRNSDTQSIPTDLAMNLAIELGDDVKVSYGDLKTMLLGKVVIRKMKGGLPIANGELHTVKGRYKAYGKLLKITSGKIIYTGNLISDPGLEIRAEQKFKTVALETGQSQFNDTSKLGSVYSGSNEMMVGILVKGTVNKPYLTLYSDPPGMTQADMLSYLVFGYPQSNIKNAGSLALLNQLASSVGSDKSGMPDVTKKIKKTLGLSDLSVGSTEYFDTENKSVNTATTLNIGKKLSKNLSIHYSVGLFNSLSILNLKYQINKRLAIQTETNNVDNGADIIYEFERD